MGHAPVDRGGNVLTFAAIAHDDIRTGLSMPGQIDGDTITFFIENLFDRQRSSEES